MRAGETVQALGLTAKSGTAPEDLTEDSFYRTGTLLRVMNIQPAEDGYVVAAQVGERMRAIPLAGNPGGSRQPASRAGCD